MGSGASQPGAFEKLPDPVDEVSANIFLGKCFDRADWETITQGSGSCPKKTFVTTIEVRNSAPSLRAWLEHWRIDELTEMLEDLDVIFPADITDLEPNVMQMLQDKLKTVQKKHWAKALAHAEYMKTINFDKPPSPLHLWLESWRLQRLGPGLFALGCDVKEDLIDLTDADVAPLQMKLLEQRRWSQGTKQLMMAIRKYDFNDDTRSSVPSLNTWLESLRLHKIAAQLDDMGAVELCDLADIDERDLATLGLNKLQRKHWHMGVHQVMQAQKEAALDGINDDPTFRGWLDGWRLSRLYEKMDELGAYVQQDLLDLEPSEYKLLGMRPLEAKRFEQAMIALENEFAEWSKHV